MGFLQVRHMVSSACLLLAYGDWFYISLLVGQSPLGELADPERRALG